MQAARRYMRGRAKRGIAAVEEAQMDLALVPAARRRERRLGAIEQRDRHAAPRQKERGGASHDTRPENGDPLTPLAHL